MVFLEKLPFVSELNFKIEGNERANFIKTNNPKVFRYKEMILAPIICIESIYPDYIREFTNLDANLFIIIANEGWCGNASGYQQHAYYANSIAVQFRKDIARCANTGRSLFIDSDGNASAHSEWWKEAVMIKELTLSDNKTFCLSCFFN